MVRRLAHSLGVDLAEVTGTGAGGRITHADVETAAHARETPAAPTPTGARVRSSPRARGLAARRGVDLAALQGSGPGVTGDHRASDGHEGSLFLADLEDALAHSDSL
ncbi:MAG: E3 binding domain-containing protein [Motilibacteraceae bacterium]